MKEEAYKERMSMFETSETFEDSLRSFGACAKMNLMVLKNCMKAFSHHFDDQPSETNRELRRLQIHSLMNQLRFESIDLIMKEVSPEIRKEMMDFAWDDGFEKEDIPSGKYLRDWFDSRDGSNKY